jgi:hypothetical protein
VRVLLEKLLTNKAFFDEALARRHRWTRASSTRTWILVSYVGMLHRQTGEVLPHDHGSSWVIYGQAVKYTDMSEFRLLDGGNGAGEAKLEQVKSYRLEPGHPASTMSASYTPMKRSTATISQRSATSATGPQSIN